MDEHFDIYLTGTVQDGADRGAAIRGYAQLVGIDPGTAESVFATAPRKIKSDCDRAAALDFLKHLQRLHIRYVIRPAGHPLLPPEHNTPVPAGAKHPKPFTFSGSGGEYFRIWIVNLLLTIVTLGFYAPWAKVRNRQYFFGNTNLDNASFEYTASPIKLLIGRIVALVLLFAYYIAGTLSPATSALVGLLLMIVIPWAANKSMAFNARNTVYRNIRFRFRGEYPQAFVVFILWPLAGFLTLGLLLPVALQRWQRYRIDNHSFGDKSFRFSAGPGGFYKLGLLAFAVAILGAVAGALLASLIPGAGLAGLMIGYALALVYFATGLNNLVYNNSTLASHAFSGHFALNGYGWIMVSNFVLVVLTLGLYLPWAKVRLARYTADHIILHAQGELDNFVAITQQDQAAFGEEFGDVFDLDFGF